MNSFDAQKLHAPEVMKNSPPKTKAKVVPTEPETGKPLDVEGLLIRVLLVVVEEVLSVAEPDPEVVMSPLPPVGFAVADLVASPMGYGLSELYGRGVAVGVGVGTGVGTGVGAAVAAG